MALGLSPNILLASSNNYPFDSLLAQNLILPQVSLLGVNYQLKDISTPNTFLLSENIAKVPEDSKAVVANTTNTTNATQQTNSVTNKKNTPSSEINIAELRAKILNPFPMCGTLAMPMLLKLLMKVLIIG